MLHAQPVQLADDRPVATAERLLSARPCTRSPAQVHGGTDPGDAIHYLVHRVHGEVRRAIGVVVSGAHPGVHEQAQMRIVDLGDVGAGVADQLQLAAEDGTQSRTNDSRVG